MEIYVVVSKLKKYIKEKEGHNTSSTFPEALSKIIENNCLEAIANAKKNNRKTVMGRDFNLYVDDPQIDEILVVSSKIKAMIKEKSNFSTSSQVFEQLTVHVQRLCDKAIENANLRKRKTVTEQDLVESTIDLTLNT